MFFPVAVITKIQNSLESAKIWGQSSKFQIYSGEWTGSNEPSLDS